MQFGNEHLVRRTIFSFLENANFPDVEGRIKGLIVPHGRMMISGECAAAGYKVLKKLDPLVKWKVLLLAVPDGRDFSGASLVEQKYIKTAVGMVEVGDLRAEVGNSKQFTDMRPVGSIDKSLEMQLAFLRIVLGNFVLYPLVLGDLRPDFLAEDLKEFCARKDVFIIVTSNLSQGIEEAKARELDFQTSEAICEMDVEKMAERGQASGRLGILTTLCIGEKLGWKCKMLDYVNGGDAGFGSYLLWE